MNPSNIKLMHKLELVHATLHRADENSCRWVVLDDAVWEQQKEATRTWILNGTKTRSCEGKNLITTDTIAEEDEGTCLMNSRSGVMSVVTNRNQLKLRSFLSGQRRMRRPSGAIRYMLQTI